VVEIGVNMKKGAKYKLFLLLTFSGIFLAACSGATTPISGADSGVDQGQEEEIDQPQVDISETDPIVIDEELPAEVVQAPRQGLAASDPTVVNLVSGMPTLVEFFAFW
jgi:hypothetical protein